MRCRITRVLTVALLITVIGGHWVILQSLAWAGMIVTYAQNSSVKEAISKTFDGKHPCAVCKLVQKGTQSEKKQQAPKLETKLDPWVSLNEASLYPPDPFSPYSMRREMVFPRLETPPIPPPRTA